jgi:predicted  nucleic acid-binding Zn-ribbon protein
MQPDKHPLQIPTSVLEFHRSTGGGLGGGLHFRYDLAAVTAAAAASNTDEVVTKLREDGARLERKLARAQAEGQRLREELGQAHREGQRMAKDLSVAQAHTAHQASVAQKAREAHSQAEEHLRAVHNANKSLQTELEVARQALEKERARTVAAVSSIARLRGERDILRHELKRVRDYRLFSWILLIMCVDIRVCTLEQDELYLYFIRFHE